MLLVQATLPERIIQLHKRVRALKRVRCDQRRDAELHLVQLELAILLDQFWQERRVPQHPLLAEAGGLRRVK